jgi:hypothetical protein
MEGLQIVYILLLDEAFKELPPVDLPGILNTCPVVIMDREVLLNDPH